MSTKHPHVEVTALIAVLSAVACVPQLSVRINPDGGDAASDVGDLADADDRPDTAIDVPPADQSAPVDVRAADVGDDATTDAG